MSDWRMAVALEVLRGELNDRWPDRDIASDGGKGDEAHASKGSATDHNPWVKDDTGKGVVRARDFDEDGIDCPWLAEHLRELFCAGDPRIRYVIYERRYFSRKTSGLWAPYDGVNAHLHHLHISVSTEQVHYDSTAPWGVWPIPVAPARPDTSGEDDDMAKAVAAQSNPKVQYVVDGTGKAHLVSMTELRARRKAGVVTGDLVLLSDDELNALKAAAR